MTVRHVILLIAVATVLGACSSGNKYKKARGSDYETFMSNYATLKAGEKGEPQLVYKNPDIELRFYKKAHLEPIYVWRGAESQGGGLSSENVQTVADYFFTLIYSKLEADYEMVDDAGGLGVLDIRVAITKTRESGTAPDAVSTAKPDRKLLWNLEDYLEGEPSFVGQSIIEVEITDKSRGEVIYAGVEERTGEHAYEGTMVTWDDLEKQLEYLADRFVYRLCKERGGSKCVKPTMP